MLKMSCARKCKTVSLTEDVFGNLVEDNGGKTAVKRYTWKNSNNVSVQIITYGGTITSIKIPNKEGKIDDIVTGFNTLEEYRGPGNRYFGASIGRYANRIAKGKFTLDSKEYNLALNNNGNALHGGLKGFDKVIWNDYVKDEKLILTYLSKDMEEGYPGDLLVTITFELTDTNELVIDYKATATKTTIINLTNHSYFNLAGHNSGSEQLFNHIVTINADSITEVDDVSIPTGKLLKVEGTAFDFRSPKTLGEVIKKLPNGYDHNYCVNGEFVAKVVHPQSGRVMEVKSTQPGVQFYTANFLPEDDSCKGKEGYYRKQGAFCLETQNYPDSINKANFPSPVLKPGEIYHHKTIYKFSIQ